MSNSNNNNSLLQDVLLSGPRFRECRPSPDGCFLAFVSAGLLHVRRTDPSQPVPPTVSSSAIRTFAKSLGSSSVALSSLPLSTNTAYGGGTYCWTPDSSSLVLSSRGTLFRVSVTGGLPMPVVSPDNRTLETQFGDPALKLYAPSISQDGTIYAVCEGRNRMRIVAIPDDATATSANAAAIPTVADNAPGASSSSAGPSIVPVVDEMRDIFTYDPCTSPADPNLLVFHSWRAAAMMWTSSWIAMATRTHTSAPWVVRYLDGGEGVQVGYPRFSPDGQHLLYASDRTGRLSLWIASAADNFATSRVLVDLAQIQAELAWNSWCAGTSTFAWVGRDAIALAVVADGVFAMHVAKLDLSSTATVQLGLLRPIQSLPRGFYENVFACSDGASFVAYFSDYHTVGTTFLVSLSADRRAESATTVLQGGFAPGSLMQQAIGPKPVHFAFPIDPVVVQSLPPVATWSTEQASALTTTASRVDTRIDQAYAHLYIPKQVLDAGAVSGAPAGLFGVPTPTQTAFMIHGGPTGMATDNFFPLVSHFVSKGWIVCAVNYRGSRGYGRPYREALNENWGVHDVADLQAARNFLIQAGIADPARTVCYGASAGGYTTLMALALHGASWAAGIDINGVTSLAALEQTTHLLERFYFGTLVGTPAQPDQQALLYTERSPLTHVSRITKPLIIFQGDADTVVPKAQALAIRAAVQGPVEFYIFEGEGHVFSSASTYASMFARADAFLAAHVP
ncbi:hypothetical protein CAOG_00180 [Capsaspora owczarzaki ATCC 30864]|uniref:Peptidase S9 prolyl oligopeptidase catalytic domain-containing protein n=1 Tax=Capsaspora owczarzaki (strain ATCC 30864) TaxID=595528 RepID=A0A0D2X069_CAPO3|nr:hypothetical protein CAOG_00180 [Capsaspora owczarzaki ATCC 30864]KJE88539.1 hypothetical protein CAOG_000180 [Capsaspora owczarzaki ATCC 30864]|eukprot:XP_004365051.2 hypothetical protein CAOG_00180 [Capsaspora owczarzaki ATCC 30864]